MYLEDIGPQLVVNVLTGICLAALLVLPGCIFSSEETSNDGQSADAAADGSDTRDDALDAEDAADTEDQADAIDSTQDGDADTSTDTSAEDTTVSPDACTEEQEYCTNSCVNLMTDPDHCGSCDSSCETAENATAVCAEGSCTFECEEGFSDYNGDPADGCEMPCEYSRVREFYLDSDDDGYGADNTEEIWCPSQVEEGYVTADGDCNDSLATVNPMAGFHDSPRPNESYDWDCSGPEEPQYTGSGSCNGGAVSGCTLNEGWSDGQPACGEQANYVVGCDRGVVCSVETERRTQGCK